MTLLYLLLSISLAEDCPRRHESLGPISFSLYFTPGSKCNISATTSSLRYPDRRSQRFLKDGQINVFTEIESAGKGKQATGFRTYFVLPANQSLDLNSTEHSIKIHDSAGLDWVYDKSGNIKVEQKCNFRLSQSVSWETESTANGKNGGFYIEKCPNSIIVDSGFKRGGNNVENPKATSQVRDSNGKSCSVTNDILFKYAQENPKSKELQAIIKSNRELYTELSKVCPGLNLDPLNTITTRQPVENRR